MADVKGLRHNLPGDREAALQRIWERNRTCCQRRYEERQVVSGSEDRCGTLAFI